MKTDQELEQLMRTTFAGRAQTINRGPAWSGNQVMTGNPNPQRRWIAVLAAAAAVVAVVASVAVLRNRSDKAPAISPTPTPTVSHAVTPTPSPTTRAVPPPAATCTTTLPQAWKSAVQNSTVDSGSPTPDTANTWILAVNGNDVIASRDDGPIPGSGREVVLLRPGHSPKTLYSVPNPDTYNVTSGSVSGKWLVVGIWRQARAPKNTVGGNTPDVIDAIIAVDTTTGHSHVVASAADYLKAASGKGLTIVNETVFNGKVYWNERASYSATKGTVKSYNLNTGAIRTVANADGTDYLIAQTEGLVFDVQGNVTMLVPATLPAAVQRAMTPFARAHLDSDGKSYGWAVDTKTIGFWRQGMSAPTYATIPGGFDTDDGGGTPAVAGDYMITMPAGGPALLTDMVTKASATLADGDFPHGRGQLFYGSNGTFAGFGASGISSHYVNGYWLDSPSNVVRVDTAGLPKLAC